MCEQVQNTFEGDVTLSGIDCSYTCLLWVAEMLPVLSSCVDVVLVVCIEYQEISTEKRGEV